MQYKPTSPAGLPYSGAPLGMHDLVMQQVNFEDRVRERAERHASVMPPSKRIKLPKFKLTEAAKVAFGAQIYRFALSFIKI